MINFEQTIYKKDTKGKLRFLTYQAKDNLLVQTSGIVGTENPVTQESVCTEKNWGKANYRSANDQAIFEAKAKVKKKLVKEYFESVEEVEKNVNMVYAMLAKKYELRHIKNAKMLHVQKKYDGYRCLIHVKDKKATLYSRANHDVNEIFNGSMKHIALQMSYFPDGIYDGELFNKELGSFQEQTKAIKKYREGISEKVNYIIYDLVMDVPYKDRFNMILSAVNTFTSENTNIHYAQTIPIPIESETKDFGEGNIVKTLDLIQEGLTMLHNSYVEDGYEGLMVRVDDCKYKSNARSSQLLKMKMFYDLAGEIIDVIPHDADPTKGKLVVVALEDVGGVTKGTKFICGSGGSDELLRDMLANKKNYIQKTGEFRFFEATDDGDLRHATFHGIRLDK